MEWLTESIEKVISFVQERPFLFDVSSAKLAWTCTKIWCKKRAQETCASFLRKFLDYVSPPQQPTTIPCRNPTWTLLTRPDIDSHTRVGWCSQLSEVDCILPYHTQWIAWQSDAIPSYHYSVKISLDRTTRDTTHLWTARTINSIYNSMSKRCVRYRTFDT